MAKRAAVDDGIVVVGARSYPLRDAYHSLLRMRWSGVLAVIATLYLVANLVFAAGYTLTGGIHGARPGSLRDAFFFSVQTLGTMGYGTMAPSSTLANGLVVAESIAGVVLTALATGIVFTRFSQTRGELVFTSRICISPMNGIPTVAMRVGNDRASAIVDAVVRVVVTRTEKTLEGVTFYRMLDLKLVRDRAPVLSRSWTILHTIDEESPLWGLTPETAAEDDVELYVNITGTDDTSLQPVHGRRRYLNDALAWGARPADVLSDLPDGRVQLDVRAFDDVVATQPTVAFPYPTKNGRDNVDDLLSE